MISIFRLLTTRGKLEVGEIMEENQGKLDIVKKEESNELEQISEEEILGYPTIEIKNLTVSPLPSVKLGIGDADGFHRIIQERRLDIKGVIWNEYEICLITRDPNIQIKYKPEFTRETQTFFIPENKRYGNSFFDEGVRAWEGDTEPVQFSKRNLLKFLSEYGCNFPPELEEAIRKLRVSKTLSIDAEMLDIDTDNERRIEEDIEKTNLPRKFTVSLPVSEGYIGEIDFEARVVKLKDGYRDTGRLGVELRCTNCRKVLREMMEGILNRIPESLPIYYGQMEIERK